MAKHRGHIHSGKTPVHHGRLHDKEGHKGGVRYTGPTETHNLRGMPDDHMLDPPSRSLSLRGRTGHGGSGTRLGTRAPDKRLGYTR